MNIPVFYSRSGKACATILLFLNALCPSAAQTWVQKTDFAHGPSVNACILVINDSIYVANTGDTAFYRYDYLNDAWLAKKAVPAALFNRVGAKGFSVNGKGYMIGGINNSGACMDEVWEYDPIADHWAKKANFPGGKRADLAAFVIGDKAYVGGGIDTLDVGGLSTSAPKNDFWEYTAANDTWLQKADLPYDSSYLDWPFAFSDGVKGYVIAGGRYKLTNGAYTASDVPNNWQYDPAVNSWNAKSDFPGTARSGGISFVINNKAYCGTGLNDLTEVSYNDFYEYDMASDTWSGLGISPLRTRTYAIAANVSNGKAYLGTGWRAPQQSFLQDWWEFTPAPEDVNNITGSKAGLYIYPNPSSNTLHVQWNDKNTAVYTCNVYNMLGQLVLANRTIAKGIIDISTLPEGSYVLYINADTKAYKCLFTVSRSN